MKHYDITFLAAQARKNPCLITGADLLVAVVAEEGKLLHGDLHMVGEAFVFNGVRRENGEAAWTWDTPEKGDRLIFLEGGRYFERRGVVVFAAENATLSDEARKYLGLDE